MLPVMFNNEGEENDRIHIYTLSVTRQIKKLSMWMGSMATSLMMCPGNVSRMVGSRGVIAPLLVEA